MQPTHIFFIPSLQHRKDIAICNDTPFYNANKHTNSLKRMINRNKVLTLIYGSFTGGSETCCCFWPVYFCMTHGSVCSNNKVFSLSAENLFTDKKISRPCELSCQYHRLCIKRSLVRIKVLWVFKKTKQKNLKRPGKSIPCLSVTELLTHTLPQVKIIS